MQLILLILLLALTWQETWALPQQAANTKGSNTFPTLKWKNFEWLRSSAPIDKVLAYAQFKSANQRVASSPMPSFDPGLDQWSIDQIRMRNNCYNYATALITNTFAQPGGGSGNLFQSLSECSGIVQSSISDGLIPVKSNEIGQYDGSLNTCHYVALAITAANASRWEQDFHWFRLMKPGVDPVDQAQWWHKPGSLAVMRTGFNNQTIFNLETADRGPYKRICGYFRTCVQIA